MLSICAITVQYTIFPIFKNLLCYHWFFQKGFFCPMSTPRIKILVKCKYLPISNIDVVDCSLANTGSPFFCHIQVPVQPGQWVLYEPLLFRQTRWKLIFPCISLTIVFHYFITLFFKTVSLFPLLSLCRFCSASHFHFCTFVWIFCGFLHLI